MQPEPASDVGIRLPLEGKIGLRNAREILNVLDEALNSFPEIEIDLGGVTEADICAVQLLIGARKSARGAGRKLGLVVPRGGVVEKVLIRAGVLDADGSARGPDHEFWRGRSASATQVAV